MLRSTFTYLQPICTHPECAEGYLTPMLHVVEIRRDREHLAQVMSAIREWLDAQRFEPDAFRCDQDGQTIVCRVEFKVESEARACADAFRGQLRSVGHS